MRSSGAGAELVLERDSAPGQRWREASGTYRVAPPLGESTRIVEEDGRLLVRNDPGWPAELELVPLTAPLAIALASEEFGTLLHLRRDRDGAVRGFTWERADGTTFHGSREGR